MLSNSEFAVYNHVPTELGGDMADFAMFSLNMGNYRENHEIVFPHLQGKGINLWDVVPVVGPTIHQVGMVENKSAEQEKELIRQANLAKYIGQGYAFESPTDKCEDDPQDEGDEWDKFFAVDTPPIGGKGRRKSGVKSHSHFEGFVDSAQ